MTKDKFNDFKKSFIALIKYCERLKKCQIKCPDCGSFDIIRKGNRYIQRGGIKTAIQKYGCDECGSSFSQYGMEWRMRTSRQKIELALKLRLQGKTLSQIVEELGGKPSRQTVLRWIKKYSEFMPAKKKEVIVVREMNCNAGTRQNYHVKNPKYTREFKIKV